MIERWAYLAGAVLMDADPAGALRCFREFELWAAAELGPGDPEVAQAVARQGWCQARLGHQAAARELFARALSLIEAAADAHHPAAVQLSRYLRGGQPASGQHPAPPRALHGLAPVSPFGTAGITAEALDAERDRLADAARQLGHPGPSPGSSVDAAAGGEDGFAVGRALAEIGEFGLAAEAMADYARWAAFQHGPGHPSVLESIHQLAYCHSQLGNHVRACDLYASALQLTERASAGSSRSDVLAAAIGNELFEAGRALAWAGRPADALTVLEAAELWASEWIPSGDPLLAEVITGQAWCHIELGNDRAARSLYQRARQRFEPDDPVRREIDAYLEKEGSQR